MIMKSPVYSSKDGELNAEFRRKGYCFSSKTIIILSLTSMKSIYSEAVAFSGANC